MSTHYMDTTSVFSKVFEEINDLFVIDSDKGKILKYEDWNKYLKGKEEVIETEKKYYICKNCGDLITNAEINTQIECGGTGLCDCEFTQWFWNDNIQKLDVDTPRIYNDWIEINKEVYNLLLNERNTVLRLRMFNQIPKEKRL